MKVALSTSDLFWFPVYFYLCFNYQRPCPLCWHLWVAYGHLKFCIFALYRIKIDCRFLMSFPKGADLFDLMCHCHVSILMNDFENFNFKYVCTVYTNKNKSVSFEIKIFFELCSQCVASEAVTKSYYFIIIILKITITMSYFIFQFCYQGSIREA